METGTIVYFRNGLWSVIDWCIGPDDETLVRLASNGTETGWIDASRVQSMYD